MMTISKPDGTSRNPYTFILCCDQFDGETASIFATRFRRADLHVKIVGTHGAFIRDQHGLMLRPDMLLSDAAPLASKAICIILPCPPMAARRLQEDPRVMRFLAAAVDSRALLIASSPAIVESTDLRTLATTDNQWAFYGTEENVIPFAVEQANELKNTVILPRLLV